MSHLKGKGRAYAIKLHFKGVFTNDRSTATTVTLPTLTTTNMFIVMIAMFLTILYNTQNSRQCCQMSDRRQMKNNRQPAKATNRIGRQAYANNRRRKQRRMSNKHYWKCNINRKKVTQQMLCCGILMLVAIVIILMCWNPYTASRIGEAAKPGPVTIVSRNIHGLYANLMECTRSGADIINIQEADIAESDVIDFTSQASDAGYNCKWGQPIQIAKTDGGKNGRRVAILVKKPAEAYRQEDTDEQDDSNLKYLRSTGRWMEVIMPVGNGEKQIVNATLYGISGANSDNAKFEENERLVAAALIRMNMFKDVPYYLCTDINVEPTNSNVLTKAREACIAYDIVYDFYEGKPPPTFKADGVCPDMEGSGITRLDTIISNGVATHAIDIIRYDYANGKGFDHVPIVLTLNEERFSDEIETSSMPAALVLRSLTGMSQAERNKALGEEAEWFTEIWQWHQHDFQAAIQDKKVDEAHRIWCLAAEQFLWKCQRLDGDLQLPRHKPRRGQTMPTFKQQVTASLCKETGVARNSFTKSVDRVIGIARDMLMRLRRLANGEERRDKATKEQLKENSEKIFRIRADENEGEIQDSDSKTKEYDSQTAGKTLWRLAKATRNLKEAINKILPSKERKVKYIARKNGSYEKQESVDDDIDECERMTSIRWHKYDIPYVIY